jgi:hypothetical protein
MAETALKELNEQIKLVRQEAYAAGFDGAMRAIRAFSEKAVPSEPVSRRSQRAVRAPRPAPAPSPRPKRAPATAKVPKEHRTAAAPRRARGANTQLVKQVLQANAPRPMRPVEIRRAIQRDKGTSIAFTSIRQSLDQLEARKIVEQVDGKTWRHHLGTGAVDLSA